jgi:hypothetical protein
MTKVMKKTLSILLVALAYCSHANEAHPETDGEIWNRGVEEYRQGAYTNALSTLRPLILSKTHGPRAAELAGAVAYSQSDKAKDDPEKRLALLENAAADFQLALRSAPDDQRMNRNFTRATDRLPAFREEVHIAKVLKELGQQDPGALLGAGVKDVRLMMEEFPAALTNGARFTVAKCEALAKRAEKLNDIWIAVKSGVAQSVTNEQQAMTIMAQVEEARKATEDAATALYDIRPEAQSDLSKAESSLTRFWKLAILPPAACDESILAQTNELLRVENKYGRDWQKEALEFTQVFRAKFPAWAQAYEQQAQSDTNKPPFTKEAQAEISALSVEVEKTQLELANDTDAKNVERKGGGKAADRAVKQLEVLKKLARIKDLLPKDKNGGSQNQNPNQQNLQQNQDKNQDKNDKNQNQEQNQNQDQQNQDQKDDKKEKQEEKQDDKSSEMKDDREVEDLIRRAQERNDEHEAEKKARMKNAPLPPNERDW